MSIKITCEICGKLFTTIPSVLKKGGSGRFCSNKCSGKGRGTETKGKLKLKTRKRTNKVCNGCGKEFEVKLCDEKRGRGKFCNAECYHKFINETKENHPNWKGGKIETTCHGCGIKFFVSPHKVKHGQGKYHNKECLHKTMVGTVGFMKGKTHSNETKQKLRLANLGKHHTEETRKKIGLINKGKKFTEEHIKNMNLARTSRKGIPNYGVRGINNHNWKGGKTIISDRLRGSLEYQQWRQKIFLRDDFTCQKCKTRGGYLEAHHIKSFSILIHEANNSLPLFDLYTACIQYTPTWDVSNGITLCSPCHKKTRNYLYKNNKKP